MKMCPYCHEQWDNKHSLVHMAMGTFVGCPKYPKNENPMFMSPQWYDKTADLSHLKSDIKGLLDDREGSSKEENTNKETRNKTKAT